MVELVAHRAGNSMAGIEPIRSIADSIEIDVHLHRRELVVRHAKRLWLTDRLWDRWYLLPRGTRVPLLDDVLEWVGPGNGVGLWIDCKGWQPSLGSEVVRAVGDRGPLTLSSKTWWTLRGAVGAPGVRTMRAIGNRFELLLLRIIPPPAAVEGVVVHSRLVSRRLVADLHRQDRVVFSWSIPTADVGRRLVELGVDGLIIDDPALLASFRDTDE